MALRFWLVPAALLYWNAAAWAQPASAPIVQPGAPGESSKVLSAASAGPAVREPSDADTKFMQGMIMHHSQAVEMTALLRTRSHNKHVQALGKRISISQTDEIRFMRDWLADHGKSVPTEHDVMAHMAGMANMNHASMNQMDMGSMPMMPGMLTPQQMKELAKATGPAFDRLFLTGMIQHHTGALVMVQDLFDTPGAGQDSQLFDFATDVDNTQRAEIKIMQGMLKEKK
jgi:uncharacterized protein (DUF305 family)